MLHNCPIDFDKTQWLGSPLQKLFKLFRSAEQSDHHNKHLNVCCICLWSTFYFLSFSRTYKDNFNAALIVKLLLKTTQEERNIQLLITFHIHIKKIICMTLLQTIKVQARGKFHNLMHTQRSTLYNVLWCEQTGNIVLF
jgi:hypothetical protein